MAFYSSSCSNVIWESDSIILVEQQRPSIESRLDMRCYQDFLTMRKKKLLEKLVETRTNYENLRNQILSNITNVADKEESNKKKLVPADNIIIRQNLLHQIVNLIDKGNVESRSEKSNMKNLMNGDPSSRETYKHKEASSRSRSDSTKESYKRGRAVSVKAKRIRYGPSTCVSSASSNITTVAETALGNNFTKNDITAKYSASMLNRYIFMNYEDTLLTHIIRSTTLVKVSNSKLDTKEANFDKKGNEIMDLMGIEKQVKQEKKIRNRKKKTKMDSEIASYESTPHNGLTPKDLGQPSEHHYPKHRLNHPDHKHVANLLNNSSYDLLPFVADKTAPSRSGIEYMDEFSNQEFMNDSKHISICVSKEFLKNELDNTSIVFSTNDLNMHIMCMHRFRTQNKLHEEVSAISTNTLLSEKLSELIKQIQSKSIYDMFLKKTCRKSSHSKNSTTSSRSSVITIGEKQVYTDVKRIKIATPFKTPNTCLSAFKPSVTILKHHKLAGIEKKIDSSNIKIEDTTASLKWMQKNQGGIKTASTRKTMNVSKLWEKEVSNNTVVNASKLQFKKNISKIEIHKDYDLPPTSKNKQIVELFKIASFTHSGWENKTFINSTVGKDTVDSEYDNSSTTRIIVSSPNQFYSPTYDVCYNFLCGPNCAAPSEYYKEQEIRNNKTANRFRPSLEINSVSAGTSSNFNMISNANLNIHHRVQDSNLKSSIHATKNVKGPDVCISTFKRTPTYLCKNSDSIRNGTSKMSSIFDSSYYTFNLRNSMNTPYKLKDFECEPGVCIPNECDPIECDKRIKKRLHKHKTVQSSTCLDTKSISTGGSSCVGKEKRNQVNLQSNSQPCRRDCPGNVDESKSVTGRSGVRFGSELSVNVEFYKEHSPESEIHSQQRRKSQTSSVKSTSIKKRAHRNTGIEPKCHNRGSQIKTQVTCKSTGGVSKLLQRCFCTLQLRKKSKAIKPIISTNVASQCLVSPKKYPHYSSKKDTCGEDCKSVGTTIKHQYKAKPIYKLRPGECEPGVCIPNECDPIECEKRIKRRQNRYNKNVQSSPSSDSKSINTESIKSKARARKSQAHFKTNSSLCKPCRQSKLSKCEPRAESKNVAGCKSLRFGSDISLNVEFFMERPSFSGKNINDKVDRKRKKINCDTTIKPTGQHRKTQVETETANKCTGGVGKFLQRCFCTLKLQKQDKKKIKTTHNKSVAQKNKGARAKKPKKDTCGTDCKSVGTKTKHKHKAETKRKLEDGECEPGVCVPNECDPIQCEKRLKNRLRKLSKTVQSLAGSDDKSVNTDHLKVATRVRKNQAHLQTKSHPSKPCRQSRQSNLGQITEHKNEPGRKSFRFGSDISLNLEFFVEHPSACQNVSGRSNTTIIKTRCRERKKVHRDTTMKPQSHHRDCQARIQTSCKGTGISKFLTRCFCTLKLQKSGKSAPKKNSPQKIQKRRDPKKAKTKKGTCDEDCRSVATETKNKFKAKPRYKLKPGECEPGICVPNECDPQKCLEKMRHRLKDCKQTGTDKPKLKSASTNNTNSVPDAKSTCCTMEHKKRSAKRTFTQSKPRVYDSAHPSRQSIHLGSNLRLSIDFFKETTAIGDHPSHAFNIPKQCRDQDKSKQCHNTKSQGSGGNLKNDKKHDKTQAVVKSQHKATEMRKILKRCFCTLQSRKRKSDVIVKKQPLVVKSKGTKTSNKVRFKAPVASSKLKPYECEPNVCVPGQCDPHECEKRIKRRNKHTKEKSASTDFGNKKKCSFCNTITSSKLNAKTSQSKPCGTEKRKESQSVDSGKSVRFGSSISFNIEFYKDNGFPQSYSELKKHHPPSEILHKRREYQRRNIKMKNKEVGALECGKCNKKTQGIGPAQKNTASSSMTLLQRCFCTLKSKNKKAQSLKSVYPSGSRCDEKNNKNDLDNMETAVIMPYSKKKFKKYASETKLDQKKNITPTAKKQLRVKFSETALGSRSNAIAGLIKKCKCHIRDKYRSSCSKRKQGINIKVEPKVDKTGGTKHHGQIDKKEADCKYRDQSDNVTRQPHKQSKNKKLDQNDSKKRKNPKTVTSKTNEVPTIICQHCGKNKNQTKKTSGKVVTIEGDPKTMKKKREKDKKECETHDKVKVKRKKGESTIKPVGKAKSFKTIEFCKPPVKPTKSERQPEKTYGDTDLCDHCGKHKRKQKTKYSRVYNTEDITLAKTKETPCKPDTQPRGQNKDETKANKLKHNFDDQCDFCNAPEILEKSGHESKSKSKKKARNDKLETNVHEAEPCEHCRSQLPSDLTVKSTEISKCLKSEDKGDKQIIQGTPCVHCHSPPKKTNKNKLNAKEEIKSKFDCIFRTCSGSIDAIVQKLTSVPAIRKIQDSIKCVSAIIKKDYTEDGRSKENVDFEGTQKDNVLEVRIDNSGMCILNSEEIRERLMKQAQEKFRKTQKENSIEAKKDQSDKKKKNKKEKKLQTQKQEDSGDSTVPDHSCKICCQCQEANRDLYENMLCKKKLVNKHLVCCEEPNTKLKMNKLFDIKKLFGSKKGEPKRFYQNSVEPIIKPDFSVYIDSRNNAIVDDLDFRQNTAREKWTGCPICDAELQAKKDAKFPVPPVEIVIDKANLSIMNLPKVKRKMRETLDSIELLQVEKKKEKAALVCPCSSTCRKEIQKAKPKPVKRLKKTGICPCGDICKGPLATTENEKDKKQQKKGKDAKKKGKSKGNGKDKGKKSKEKEKREKQKEMAKKISKAQKEKKALVNKKLEIQRRNKLQAQYKKEDAKRRKERLRSDRIAYKNIKKVDSDFGLLADSFVDVLTLGTNSMVSTARCAGRELIDLKGTLEKVKMFKKNPQLAVKHMAASLNGSPAQSTCQRIKYRCARMKCTQAFVSKMEERAWTNYLIHSCDKDPKKRLKYKKRNKKRERVPLDFECSLYMGQLRRKTWLWVYYACPWFYPHWRSIVVGIKQVTDMLVFLLAILVWSPCIAALELFRTFICCVVCTK